jgi:hypothetical protein
VDGCGPVESDDDGIPSLPERSTRPCVGRARWRVGDEKITGMKSDAVGALLLGAAVALASTCLHSGRAWPTKPDGNEKRDGPTSNSASCSTGQSASPLHP